MLNALMVCLDSGRDGRTPGMSTGQHTTSCARPAVRCTARVRRRTRASFPCTDRASGARACHACSLQTAHDFRPSLLRPIPVHRAWPRTSPPRASRCVARAIAPSWCARRCRPRPTCSFAGRRAPARSCCSAIATLQAQQHVPVLFFTQDAGVETHATCTGCGRARLGGAGLCAASGCGAGAPGAGCARARTCSCATKLAELGEKLDERKWVDKAKGILMRAQQVSEDEAFQCCAPRRCRATSGGQLSREVIEAARVARRSTVRASSACCRSGW